MRRALLRKFPYMIVTFPSRSGLSSWLSFMPVAIFWAS